MVYEITGEFTAPALNESPVAVEKHQIHCVLQFLCFDAFNSFVEFAYV